LGAPPSISEAEFGTETRQDPAPVDYITMGAKTVSVGAKRKAGPGVKNDSSERTKKAKFGSTRKNIATEESSDDGQNFSDTSDSEEDGGATIEKQTRRIDLNKKEKPASAGNQKYAQENGNGANAGKTFERGKFRVLAIN
jgi:hypothetical protein